MSAIAAPPRAGARSALIWVAALAAAVLAGCGARPVAPAKPAVPAAKSEFPALSGRVVDEAHLLAPATAARLEAQLAGLEQSTRHQVVVVTLNSVKGRPIEAYARDLGNHWGIGRRDVNDGVLFVVAPTERKARIAVGDGLAGLLSDQKAGEILARDVTPRFAKGDFEGGISAGTEDIVTALSPQPNPKAGPE